MVYAYSVSFELTGSDDKLLLANALHAVNSEQDFIAFSNSPYMFESGLFYRPLVNASFYLTVLTAKDYLPVQFIINILFHTFCGILLYYVLKQLKLTNLQSLVLSALYLSHPAFVSTVSWIPGRNESMLTFFILLSFLYLMKYISIPKRSFLLIHSAALLLALFTKETAVAAVPIFALYFFLFGEKSFHKKWFTIYLIWIPAILAWYISRSYVITSSFPVDVFKNIPFYLQAAGKILLPVNLSVMPVIENTSFIFGVISILVIAALYYYTENKDHKLFYFGLGWFVIFLFPSVININPEYSQDIMLETRLYLPAIGLFIAISQTDPVKMITPSKKYQSGFFILIVFLFVYSSIVYSGNYRNEISYWQNAADNSPSLDLAFSGLGLTFLQNGDYPEAVKNYKRAIELNPGNTDLYRKAAFCLSSMNRSPEAEVYYREIHKREPNDYDANLILGIIEFKKGRLTESEELLLKSKELRANDPQPELYLLKLYYSRGDLAKTTELALALRSKGIAIPEEISKALK